ncbi:hypothetical protein BGZ94_010232 [Podila epigama]|nr:hypothetical protein BGZ94_010232 [Podila epigama]
MSAAASKSARSSHKGLTTAPAITHSGTSQGKRRSSRRQSIEVSDVTGGSEAELLSDHDDHIIQNLKDDLRHMTEAKESLSEKVTELEEKLQYHEANARLKASMLSNENMDLKEKLRKLGIQLSAAEDERDSVTKEKQHLEINTAAMEDEAIELSSQLKSAWIKITEMKTQQEESTKRLFTTEEAAAKNVHELAILSEKEESIRTKYADEKKDWDAERTELAAEILLLQKKVASQSKDGKQVLDWQEERTRLRDFHKQEKAQWAAEKKGFQDQLASFKVKMSSLGMQKKAAPPEWVLERQKLVEQVTDLKSKLAAQETDQFANNTRANVRKLEKKVEALKAKLVEVLEHAKTVQAKADEERTQHESKNKKTTIPRRRRTKKSTLVSANSDSESDTGAKKRKQASTSRSPSPIPSPQPIRERPRRSAVVAKKVKYNDQVSGASGSDTSDYEDDSESSFELGPEASKASKSEKTESKKRRGTEDNESTTTSTAQASKSSTSTSISTPPPAPLKKSHSGEGGPLKLNVNIPAISATAKIPTSEAAETANANAPTTTTPQGDLNPNSSLPTQTTASESTLGKTSTAASAPDAVDNTKTGEKIKKKRRLLSGKGLDELGEMLADPNGALSSSSSSSSHLFNGQRRKEVPKSKFGFSTLMAPTTSTTKKPNQAKMDAMNAIKMQFSIPKPRTPIPGEDNDD